MSASDKKKLRKEQQAVYLTEKQRQEQAEAKKLKTNTIIFVTVMALTALIAVGSLVIGGINKSGIFERNTIAAAIDSTELNSVEMSYYYNDAIGKVYNEAYEQYTSYYELYFQGMGLDISKPLNEQINKDTGETWADFFVDSALETAKSDYTLAKLAEAEGFALPQEDADIVDSQMNSIESTAKLYGYSNGNTYLDMVYGHGANMKSYRTYLERTALANAYYDAHYDALTYDDAAIEAYAGEHPNNFNSYNYSYSYLSYTEFRQGGTEDENGNKTYSDAENAAARKALKEAAEEMATAKTLEELKEKAEKVEVNETSDVAVNDETRVLYTSMNTALADWLADASRKAGDIAAIPNISGEGDQAVTNGYYVVYFAGKTDNKTSMGNVRHLLVAFEGGEEDENGTMHYSDAEKGVAKTEAASLLKQWQEGAATEESFIELVKEHSDDSSAEDGGLFENIHPDSDYVESFLNWSIDADRKVGDVEVIESPFGYHIMYYVGDSELNYRDYMITEKLKAADQETWYDGVLETVTVAKKDLSRLALSKVVSG